MLNCKRIPVKRVLWLWGIGLLAIPNITRESEHAVADILKAL